MNDLTILPTSIQGHCVRAPEEASESLRDVSTIMLMVVKMKTDLDAVTATVNAASRNVGSTQVANSGSLPDIDPRDGIFPFSIDINGSPTELAQRLEDMLKFIQNHPSNKTAVTMLLLFLSKLSQSGKLSVSMINMLSLKGQYNRTLLDMLIETIQLQAYVEAIKNGEDPAEAIKKSLKFLRDLFSVSPNGAPLGDEISQKIYSAITLRLQDRVLASWIKVYDKAGWGDESYEHNLRKISKIWGDFVVSSNKEFSRKCTGFITDFIANLRKQNPGLSSDPILILMIVFGTFCNNSVSEEISGLGEVSHNSTRWTGDLARIQDEWASWSKDATSDDALAFIDMLKELQFDLNMDPMNSPDDLAIINKSFDEIFGLKADGDTTVDDLYKAGEGSKLKDYFTKIHDADEEVNSDNVTLTTALKNEGQWVSGQSQTTTTRLNNKSSVLQMLNNAWSKFLSEMGTAERGILQRMRAE